MFDNMVKDFKDYAELRLFCESQHKTITEISKKMVRLEDENKHLKSLLETTTDIIKKPLLADLSESDEETISRIQLARLKEMSFERELSYEECKKVSEYAKILNLSLQNSKKIIEVSAKAISTNDLMKMLDNESKIN